MEIDDPASLIGHIKKQFNKSQYCDVEIEIEIPSAYQPSTRKIFYLHRILLSRCKYFTCVMWRTCDIETGMSWKEQSHKRILVTLPDSNWISEEAFTLFFSLFYHEKFDELRTEISDNCLAIHWLGLFFRFDQVEQYCEDLIVAGMDDTNIKDIIKHVETTNICGAVRKACIQWLKVFIFICRWDEDESFINSLCMDTLMEVLKSRDVLCLSDSKHLLGRKCKARGLNFNRISKAKSDPVGCSMFLRFINRKCLKKRPICEKMDEISIGGQLWQIYFVIDECGNPALALTAIGGPDPAHSNKRIRYRVSVEIYALTPKTTFVTRCNGKIDTNYTRLDLPNSVPKACLEDRFSFHWNCATENEEHSVAAFVLYITPVRRRSCRNCNSLRM